MKQCYIAHGLSYERGNTVRKRLEGAGLIFSEIVSTETGKETRLSLTAKGKAYLRNTKDSRRLGGEWHQSSLQRIAKHYESLGYLVRTEYRDIDVYAEKDGEKVAIEVESLTGGKDLIQAVWNIQKALRFADRVESVVKDEKSARKLKEALRKSPIEKDHLDRIRIKLILSYWLNS